MDDYDYDANGNLIYDKNKSIGSITYNHLNLPLLITITGKGTITYTYDAGGNKLKKVTLENPVAGNGNKTITTTTNYINGFVYESKTTVPANTPADDYTDVLQFIPQEEGRVRFVKTTGALAYDYFIKDHLGNVRMVLTEEQQTNIYPAATLEGTFDASTNSMVNYERKFYNIDNTKIVSEASIVSWPTESVANTKLYYNHNGNPPANTNYPASCTPVQTDGSTKLYQLNATSNKTGLEYMIKVMAGDKIDIFGKSYFLNTATVNNANSTPLDLLGLMTNLLLAPANAAVSKGVSATTLNTINSGQVPNTFFRGTNGETTTIPKAYINYIFLDEQFKYAGGNFSRVGASGTVKDHWYTDGIQLQNITVPKNGYIFVYVSNESNLDVFFDNLQVIHKPGAILEETHYYPFGLIMQGISSKAAGKLENRYKFNSGIELNNDFDISLYETECRLYDPQLGRFWQVDELAEANWEWTQYNFAINNPIKFNDPLGLIDEDPKKDSKTLPNVTVKGVRLNYSQKVDLFWRLKNEGISFDKIKGEKLKEWMYNHEKINIFMEKIHAQTREQDKFILEVASFFVPVGWVTKLRYLKYAGQLFKFKRGAVLGGKAVTTVLGKVGQYEKLATQLGSNKFIIATGKYTEAANIKFLDEAITRGDKFILSNSAFKAEVGSGFKMEIDYLIEKKGYQISENGMFLFK